MSVTTRRGAPPASAAQEPAVLWLSDPAASERGRTGAKAANLSVAGRRHLPIVDGFVIPAPVVAEHPLRPPAGVREAWEELSEWGAIALVVRSSGGSEDLGDTSMAGIYDSVIDVRGWAEMVDAYATVVASAAGDDMAVLVQRFLRPDLGGVLFGCDPVSGRTDRLVIAAVEGGPHRLVSGEVQGRRLELDRSGRVRSADGDPGPVLSASQRRQLLALARRARTIFGGPQDIEWAIEGRRLILLQSRPVTATSGVPIGPLLGPGPVAETFPRPLLPLEQDLWVPPMRDAARQVLALTGASGRRRLRASPVVTVVEGQVVADLDLFGAGPPTGRLRGILDPRPHVRRLSVAWRVGRLRGAMDSLAHRLLADIDRELAALPPLGEVSDDELVHILENCRTYLCSLHGHEMLSGALLDGTGTSGAEVALSAIAAGQALGWSDEDIIARVPIALAVSAPTLGARPPLPRVEDASPPAHFSMPIREELRIRIRWVHELTRQAVHEAGRRLAIRDVLADADHVVHLSVDELTSSLRGSPIPLPLPSRDVAEPTPVPAYFRLTTDGAVVSEERAGPGGGVGAGGGRGSGPVAFDAPMPGDVLVVRTLDPDLAPLLPHLAGIVAETGSPLSHLAILARERGVPVVVGHTTIRSLVTEGTVVTVDGRTGSVEVADVTGSDG